MRIGIDARLMSERVTGIGRYTYQSVKALVANPDLYFLYCSGTPVNTVYCRNNTTFRQANIKSRVGRILWSQIHLPKWAEKDRVDLFWGATHRLPLLLPKTIVKVVTIHDLVWKRAGSTMRPLSRLLDQLLMPHAIRFADRIVAVSKSTAHDIVTEYPLVADKIRTVYPGVSILPAPHTFSSLAKFSIREGYFLFVGTLEPRKNLDRLLQAYAAMGEALKQNYQLVIAGGNGWGGIEVENLITRYGLGNYVLKLGYVSEVELATLYAHARFLVMPSLYEGFGLPILEAHSFGVPVITSNTSSMPEVAGDASILVDPYSISSIASGLQAMMDSGQRDFLAAKAKDNAARFSWKKAARDLWSVFHEALEEKRSAC